MSNIYWVNSIQKGKIIKRFLVKADSPAAALLSVQLLNNQEIQAGEQPILPENFCLSAEPVEFESNVIIID